MDRYAITITPGGNTALLHCWPGEGLDLETMQDVVDGHIETVPTVLPDAFTLEKGVGLVLIVNEYGKLRRLPVNRMATDMAAIYNDVIVGNAILMGTTEEDFIGLTIDAAKHIVRTVRKWR